MAAIDFTEIFTTKFVNEMNPDDCFWDESGDKITYVEKLERDIFTLSSNT